VSASSTTSNNPYGRSLGEVLEGSRPYERFRHMGDMGALGVTVIRQAFVKPSAWIRDAIVELSIAFRRCTVPLAISHTVYAVGYGILLFGILLVNLGISERIASAFFLIWGREIATWITAMIFAGVVGSAVTADLGARKIREELDALAVLGVKQVRALVVPRVIAMTVALPVLAMLSLMVVTVVNYYMSTSRFGFSHAVFRDNLFSSMFPLDLIVTMAVKNAILGFFVGVVACYKGITSRAGAEGVGRAVNDTVIITFFGIWLFNSLYNLMYLTLLPDAAVLKG
jgi:phospholipid/cholesterol/gamma-HCH transport system permease protein